MTLDPRSLRQVLDGRWAEVREDVRTRLGEVALTPPSEIASADYRSLVTKNLSRIVESGYPQRMIDGDPGTGVAAFGMLAYADLSLLVKAGVQFGLFGGAVQALGTSRHHAEYLEPIMNGELLGCFAMTETGHGSDVQNLRTTATYAPSTQEFVVHTPDPGARKDYIGNAAVDGRLAVVFAQLITDGTAHGVHALLVPIRDASGTPMPGVTIGDCGPKAGLNGVDNGRLTFDHVRVPREALLNAFGDVSEDGTYVSSISNETRRFFTMLGTLVRGRISVAGGAGAATQKALAIAIRYAETRRQFFDPATGEEIVVLDYLAHQRKLLPALARTYALHFAQTALVSDMHDLQNPGAAADEDGQRDLETRAAGVKAIGTWHATATIQTCREACGGAGYLMENQLPQLKADTDVFTTFEGDNTVLLQLVAKTLLSDYGRELARRDILGKARFAAGLLGSTVAEKTRLRAFAQGDVRERAQQRRLLAAREQHLLANAALRMRKALAPGADQFRVFNSAQDHLLAAAHAYVDRVVYDAFAAAVDHTSDPATRGALEQLLSLYALSTIERELAFHLEHAYLGPSRAKAVTRAVNALCTQLRPHARTLVDAFGIPESWLNAQLLR